LTPHIYSNAELHILMSAARQLHPAHRLRGETCAAVIGLIAACGLRIGEATALRRADVDFDHSCLQIRHGKFGKSRLVPMHPSTRKALRSYAQRRDRDPQCACSEAFFVFDRGRPAGTRHLHYAFREVRQALHRRPRGGHCRYRLHDLRHSFVCRRLERWYQQGADIDGQMLALSTYIGHAKPTDTYWYVTATPRLLSLAARRLEPLAAVGAA
jgi:integrase